MRTNLLHGRRRTRHGRRLVDLHGLVVGSIASQNIGILHLHLAIFRIRLRIFRIQNLRLIGHVVLVVNPRQRLELRIRIDGRMLDFLPSCLRLLPLPRPLIQAPQYLQSLDIGRVLFHPRLINGQRLCPIAIVLVRLRHAVQRIKIVRKPLCRLV